MGDLSEHFWWSEFTSGDGQAVPALLRPNVQALAPELEKIRAQWNRPMAIISGYRSPTHNAAQGGVTNSQHLYGKAADFAIPGVHPNTIYCRIRKMIREGRLRAGGTGVGPTSIHYDIGPDRIWHYGNGFPDCTPRPDEEENMQQEIDRLRQLLDQEQRNREAARILTGAANYVTRGEKLPQRLANELYYVASALRGAGQ